MRIARSTLIGTAVAVALFGREELGNAQAAAAGATAAGGQLQEVVVTGIRYSLGRACSRHAKRLSSNIG